MDVERISGVSANYASSPETARSEAEARGTDAGAATVRQMVQNATTTVVQSGTVGEGKQEEEQEQKQKERAVSEATVDDAVRSANRKMERTRCEYSYHKKTNRVSIKVIDEDTDKVIREIPPEKSLDMLQKMWEMAGILVDEKR